MKNLRIQFLIGICILLFGTSCKKQLVDKYESKDQNVVELAKSTKEIKLSKDFDWKTTKNVTLNFTGLKSAPAIVLSPEGSILNKTMLRAGVQNAIVLTLPETVTKIQVNYGGKIYALDIQGASLTTELN